MPAQVYFEVRPRGPPCPINRSNWARFEIQATLAQLVEHSIRNRKVVGSNPTGGSIKSRSARLFKAGFVIF